MSWVTVGTTVGTALIGSRSAKKARRAQEAATSQAIAVQGQAKEQALEQYKPYQGAGQSALQAMLGMQGLPGGTPFDIKKDPSYQFRLNESMGAVERSAAARGGLMSGGFVNQVLARAGEFASTEYTNIYNRLGTLVNYGMQGAGGAANVITNYGANIANLLTGRGEAQASAYAAQGNIWGQAMTEVGSMDWGKKFGGGNTPTSTGQDPNKTPGKTGSYPNIHELVRDYGG